MLLRLQSTIIVRNSVCTTKEKYILLCIVYCLDDFLIHERLQRKKVTYILLSYPLLYLKHNNLSVSSVKVQCSRSQKISDNANVNLLLTEREGRTGEYCPEVLAVQTERSKVRTKTTEGQYSPVRLELARLVSSLLYSPLQKREGTGQEYGCFPFA